MIKDEVGYKTKIEEIAKLAEESKLKDFNVRYIYREKENNGEKKSFYYESEEIVMTETGKEELIKKFRNALTETSEKEKTVHPSYKFDQDIKGNHVAILNNDDFPNELNKLIEVFSNPVDFTKVPKGKKGHTKRESIIGFAVKFKDTIAFKKISRLDVATGKKFKNTILIGSISNKVRTFDEDLIILTMSEPDFIVFNDDGNDPAIIYNSYNFAQFSVSHQYMMDELSSANSQLLNLLDKPEGLQEYLKRTPSAVHVIYYSARQKQLSIDQKYIGALNQQFLENKLQLDTNNRLMCNQLSGKDIYNILLGKYGSHLNTDGMDEKVILDNYKKM